MKDQTILQKIYQELEYIQKTELHMKLKKL